MALITRSICSLSWINERSHLPENDGTGPDSAVTLRDVMREHDTVPYRFANVLEATVEIVPGPVPQIVRAGFTGNSRIYTNPSFAGIPSQPFSAIRRFVPSPAVAIFIQTVGVRTVSPEMIGAYVGAAGTRQMIGDSVEGAARAGTRVADGLGMASLGRVITRTGTDAVNFAANAGAAAGRAVAHDVAGLPPIWTTLLLCVYADGRAEGSLVEHSLFPSVSYYEPLRIPASLNPQSERFIRVGDAYNAVPRLQEWQRDGWGRSNQRRTGPAAGNPWGFNFQEEDRMNGRTRNLTPPQPGEPTSSLASQLPQLPF